MDTDTSNLLGSSITLHSAVYQQLHQQPAQQQQQYNPCILAETFKLPQHSASASKSHGLAARPTFYQTDHLQPAEQIPTFSSVASHIPQPSSISPRIQTSMHHHSHPVSNSNVHQVQALAETPQLDEIETYQLKFESPMKLIENPPDLQTWRERLFNVDEPIFLTEDEFQTYFPHVDNVYSHRSTQTYKLKPFVSHYWNCRLKGRPPGTAKSLDPARKKRRRVARERDLCGVKIKIVEYDRGTIPQELEQQHKCLGHQTVSRDMASAFPGLVQSHTGIWMTPSPVYGPQDTSVSKWFSIQRINGKKENGNTDSVPGPHKHSIEESDRIKKNSVFRLLVSKNGKSRRSTHQKKTYAQKATGEALSTVQSHSSETALKLYGACFCPFVQRAWIALEIKRVPYQYIEVDPYKKPQSLLDISPKGLVPAIRHGPEWSINDSAIIMEYLEDLGQGTPLLPSTPQQKAHSRLWTLHVHSKIIPAFYRYLQEQDGEKQIQYAKEFKETVITLVDAADQHGPFFLGPEISFVDVQVAPWVIRMRRVLSPYRGWPDPEPGTRYARWVDAIEHHKAVQATTSTDDLYLDSYERYAENRPNTSQLADAINTGRGLP